MGNYNNNNSRNSNDRNRRRGSDRPRFGSQNSGRTQMHDATCADCGNNCKVPFMPSSGKPVYCSDCFEKRGNGRDDRRNDRPSFGRRDDRRNDKPRFTPKSNAPTVNYDKQFKIINSKLDEILRMLDNTEEITPVKKEKKAKTVKVEAETKATTVKEKAAPKKEVAKKTKAKAAEVESEVETVSEIVA